MRVVERSEKSGAVSPRSKTWRTVGHAWGLALVTRLG
jgi:hypothetical protein